MTLTSLPWTDDAEANILLATQPTALLIGFVLDQQVTVQKAFSGPKVLRDRLGHLDPSRIDAMDPEELVAVFAARPALHRFPAVMARRVHDLCVVISRDYDGDPSRIWLTARDGDELVSRLRQLPGLGPMKIASLTTLLHDQYQVRPPGLQGLLPTHPTLGQVSTPEQLAAYQAAKREYKARRRAAQEA